MASQIICSLLAAYATFLILISTSCHCHNQTSTDLPPKVHVALFIFGDSLFDPGNNNYIGTTYKANFWPYGETFFGYPTGRFSDGRVIPDFIAAYAGLPLIPSYLQPSVTGNSHKFIYGVNFASAGAGALVETHQGFVINLYTQVIYFKKVVKSLKKELGDTKAKNLLNQAVYLISIGANEYFSRSSKRNVAMVMGNLTISLKEIYNLGGRKFGFPGMAPLGCSPFLRSQLGGPCSEKINKLSRLHQKKLPKTLRKLKKKMPYFKYSVYNFYKAISERIDNPSKYGLKDATNACYRGNMKKYELCENSSEYLYFDSAHPSEKADQQFAEEMWSGGSDVVSPYNIKQLFEA